MTTKDEEMTKKSVYIRARLDSTLKADFERACDLNDLNTSEVLRLLMKQYVIDSKPLRLKHHFDQKNLI